MSWTRLTELVTITGLLAVAVGCQIPDNTDPHCGMAPTVPLATMDISDVIKLYGRSDMDLERSVLNGHRHVGIVASAREELDRRFQSEGIAALPPQTVALFNDAVRSSLREQSGRENWSFAIRHAPDAAVAAFARADVTWDGHDEKLARRLHESSPDALAAAMAANARKGTPLEAKAALDLIADFGLVGVADDVFAASQRWSWLIRMSALLTLDRLDDPRTQDAMTGDLGRLREIHYSRLRTSSPLLLDMNEVLAASSQEVLRVRVMEAMVQRDVPGLAKALERIARDHRFADGSGTRVEAAKQLTDLDEARGLQLVEDLLASANRHDITTGIQAAVIMKRTEFREALQALTAPGNPEDVQREAKNALSMTRMRP